MKIVVEELPAHFSSYQRRKASPYPTLPMATETGLLPHWVRGGRRGTELRPDSTDN